MATDEAANLRPGSFSSRMCLALFFLSEGADEDFLSAFFSVFRFIEKRPRAPGFFSLLLTLASSPGRTILSECGSRWDCGKMPQLLPEVPDQHQWSE